MKKIFIIWFIPILLLWSNAIADSSIYNKKQSILINGRIRTYFVHIAPTYDGRRTLPLVIVLHGGGGNAEQVAKTTKFNSKADREGFIVVYPNGTGKLKNRMLTWNAGNCCGYALEHNIDDVGFIKGLIERLQKRYRVDSNRIYVTGISNGAMMTYRLACELSDKIAAIAPVAGAMNLEDPNPAYPVSVVIFHGTADEGVLYEGGEPKKNWEGRKRVDNPVSYAVNFWLRHNNCSVVPQRETKGNIIHETYAGGINDAAVEVYTIKGGTHSWPGGLKAWEGADEPTREISATDTMWDFFIKHPKRKMP